jgi:transcriptional regulator with XRE-family HTH domain
MLGRVDDIAIGRTIRLLRQRRGWRQVDLAARARCSQSLVAELELGRIDRTTLRTIRAVLGTLDVRAEIQPRGRFADLERLADAAHDALIAGGAPPLERLGWQPALEVTYSEYGERGSIDILAVLPGARAALVIEAKTELGSAEAVGRKLDEKARLVPRIVRRLYGWEPVAVGRVLLLPETSRLRRTFASSGALGRMLPDDPARLRAWLRQPSGAVAAAWFLSPATRGGTRRTAARRIRLGARPGGDGRVPPSTEPG